MTFQLLHFHGDTEEYFISVCKIQGCPRNVELAGWLIFPVLGVVVIKN